MSMNCTLYAIPATTLRDLFDEPEELLALLADGVEKDRTLPLRKSWDGLNFVLTSKGGARQGSMGFLVSGGKPVGGEDEDDDDLGPPRVFSPGDVKKLAKAISAIRDEEFDRRFDVKQLAKLEIYPQIWGENRADLLGEYCGYFNALKQFLAAAAQRGEGIVVSLS